MGKRKKSKVRNDIIEDIKPSLALGLGATGASVLGGAFQSKLPTGMANPLTTTGSTLGDFMSPVAAIGGSTIVLKQLKKTEKKLKRRKK